MRGDLQMIRTPCIFILFSVLSTVSIQFTETTIAAACIYLAILGLKTTPMETAMPTLLASCGVSENILKSILFIPLFNHRLCRLCQILISFI